MGATFNFVNDKITPFDYSSLNVFGPPATKGVMSPKKKAKRQGPGRPPTDLDWMGCSVRFLPDEKKRLEKVVRSTGVSQAEVIREGTLRLVGQVEAEGKIVLTARKV